jgi:hypothetical protein
MPLSPPNPRRAFSAATAANRWQWAEFGRVVSQENGSSGRIRIENQPSTPADSSLPDPDPKDTWPTLASDPLESPAGLSPARAPR